jgi:hypothetical protein
MACFFVEGSRTSCAAIVVEFLLKFLDNKLFFLFLDYWYPIN